MRCAPILLTVALSLATCCMVSVTPAAAEDFRIDTDLFIGSAKEPAVETLTIFASGNIYDFLLTKPAEITVFEPRRGVLTLLNVERQVRASMTTQELLDAAVSLQTAALESKKPAFVAAAKPTFQTTTEEFQENDIPFTRLTLAGKPIQYTVVAQKSRQPNAAKDYKYFADWYARLNSVRPGNLPAGARLELNEALAKQGLIPTRVELLIQPGIFNRQIEMRSQHLVNWTLSNEDRRRIDEVGDHMASPQIRLVTFDEYCRPASK